MKYENLIGDHGLDIRDEEDGARISAVCPRCLAMAPRTCPMRP